MKYIVECFAEIKEYDLFLSIESFSEVFDFRELCHKTRIVLNIMRLGVKIFTPIYAIQHPASKKPGT